MEIKLMVTGVKGGTFKDDAQQDREYGYVYSAGEFRNSERDTTFQTGVHANKFRCPDLTLLKAIRSRLVASGKPLEILLDIDFSGKEGEVSQPVVVGIR